MKEKKQKGSVTVEIWRSELNFNPSNIKRHEEKAIRQQAKNIRSNGYLGGIVFNKTTGHLIDGHRRVQALDLIHKYDGTPATDYKIKVEMVEFDEKTEKEQMAYMALGNSKADYNLIAPFISEIDYSAAGISEEEYQQILAISASEVPTVGMTDFDEPFITPTTELDDSDQMTTEEIIEAHENRPKMTKEQVKAEKQKQDDVAARRQSTQDLYIFLSCESVEEKEIFCELLGVQPTNSMMVPIRRVLELIQ